ncbi:Ninja-family protein AFP3, partial [Cucurbita argyrosperma subsp. argyrosperma]
MKSAVIREGGGDLDLDLGLSIGGAFRNLPEKLTLINNGSDEESGVTDEKIRSAIRLGEAKRNREEERNRPLKREKKLEGLGSECDLMNNVDLQNPYPYSSLQYVPFINGYGYAFPCLTPYWSAGERILHQPAVACRSVSDVGGSKNRKTGSSGSSPVCSSSVISDNYHSSSSHEGVSSRSNSCNSSSENHVKPKACSEKLVESHVSKPRIKNSSMVNGKPPKPEIQSRHVQSFEQMPCVSTTGIAPNGTKTITTGFLYRYSNLEVSILCVCHGESFSPAEFVKHGGGGEVSHPLKHITVLPTNGIVPSLIR